MSNRLRSLSGVWWTLPFLFCVHTLLLPNWVVVAHQHIIGHLVPYLDIGYSLSRTRTPVSPRQNTTLYIIIVRACKHPSYMWSVRFSIIMNDINSNLCFLYRSHSNCRTGLCTLHGDAASAAVVKANDVTGWRHQTLLTVQSQWLTELRSRYVVAAAVWLNDRPAAAAESWTDSASRGRCRLPAECATDFPTTSAAGITLTSPLFPSNLMAPL